jgi:integrase
VKVLAYLRQYETSDGKRWLFKTIAGIDPATGKRKHVTRQGFKTKAEAERILMEMKLSLANGTYLKPENFTFGYVYEEWFAHHSKTLKITSQRFTICKFKKHILPMFGSFKIKDIKRAYCQKKIDELALIMKSVNDIKIQINLVFKYALKVEYIAKNPMEYVTVPKQQHEFIKNDDESIERNYWRKDEVKQFLSITLNELSLSDYVLFHLMIHTGARKGEILALSWNDIDFKSKSVKFTKTLIFDNNKHILQTSKTKASKRVISLDDRTISLLNKLRISQKAEYMARRKYIKEQTDFVFVRDDFKPRRLAYPNDKLESIIRSHSLHSITVHGLRHTHASLLFEAGASIKEVQERLGHTDVKMTMNIYTHVTETVKEQTAQKFLEYMEN